MATTTNKSGPHKAAAPQSTFSEDPGSLAVQPLSKKKKKNPLWGGNFFVAKSIFKTELFNRFSFAKGLRHFFKGVFESTPEWRQPLTSRAPTKLPPHNALV